MRTFIDAHVVATALVPIAGLILFVLGRRDREGLMDRASRWTVSGLAAACALLFLYYATFSAAIQFYERYFAPITLLVVTLLSLMIARWASRPPLQPTRTGACLLAATVMIGSNVYWTWRDFHLPFRGYIGDSVEAILHSAFASNRARMGFAESGRMGFLYPDRVVNLDGKMRVDALHALRDGSFARFVKSADLDFIILHGFDVEFFDRVAPGWSDGYVPSGRLTTFLVYARKR
jgi:hypothetical protein